MGRRILFIHGLNPTATARDLAYEFERCGEIVRCDIPPPRSRADSVYAFLEFYDSRDAERAYTDMHGRPFMGGTFKIQDSIDYNIKQQEPGNNESEQGLDWQKLVDGAENAPADADENGAAQAHISENEREPDGAPDQAPESAQASQDEQVAESEN